MNKVLYEPDPAKAWNLYYRYILEVANKHCPFRTLKINNQQPPYITSELLEQIKDRDFLFKKGKIRDRDWDKSKLPDLNRIEYQTSM